MNTSEVLEGLSEDAIAVLYRFWHKGSHYQINGVQLRLTPRAKEAYRELSSKRILTAVYGPGERFEAFGSERTREAGQAAAVAYDQKKVDERTAMLTWPVFERIPGKYDEEAS
jgi:hypothetical protein